MAVNTYFIDTSTGSNSNDGLDEVGINLATATWTAATRTLTQVGHGYTFVANSKVINITGGTGATTGLYEIESATANDIVLAASTTLEDVQGGATLSGIDLGSGNITSSDGPWLTLTFGNATKVNGDLLWVRAGTYAEAFDLNYAGSSSNGIRWEAYTDEIGDYLDTVGGSVIMDGESTRASAITDSNSGAKYTTFRGFQFIAHTSHGCFIDVADAITWDNCTWASNGGHGFAGDTDNVFIRCTFTANSDAGINADDDIVMIACKSEANTNQGFEVDTGICLFNFLRSNGADAIEMGVLNLGPRVIVNNTIDGDVKDTGTGIDLSNSFSTTGVVVNNIVYDCVNGIRFATPNRYVPSSHNLLNSNTSNYTGNGGTWNNEVTGDPDLTGATIGAASPAKGAGLDYNYLNESPSLVDIGALQTGAAAGGGGGLLVHPGTSGGARA